MKETKTCPKCNSENPIAANFCRKCRYEFPKATKHGKSLKPKIKSFYIKESEYVIGSTIHVIWNVDNFTKIELNGEDVTLYEEKEISIINATELKLEAFNDYDESKKTLKVMPTATPKIKRFSINHSKIKLGDTAKLSWDIDNTIKVLLRFDTEEIDVSSFTEYGVSPIKNTTYQLIAVSVDKNISITKEITVSVLKEVVINDFSTNKQQILETLPIELKWNVDNADKITLYPEDIDVTNQESITLYPNRTTVYSLVASNAVSFKESILTVGVKPLPKLDIKVSDSLSRLNIPCCEIDFSSLTTSIKETEIDRWMLSPMATPAAKSIFNNYLLKKIKGILNKRIKW